MVTEAEIAAAAKAAELKKDLDGIDTAAIITGDRKRTAFAAATALTEPSSISSNNNSGSGSGSLGFNNASVMPSGAESNKTDTPDVHGDLPRKIAKVIHEFEEEAEF